MRQFRRLGPGVAAKELPLATRSLERLMLAWTRLQIEIKDARCCHVSLRSAALLRRAAQPR